jgi:hypothetical protein
MTEKLTNREIAKNKIEKYERDYLGKKYVFINNNSDVTNIIFTGGGQKYYMMISWFNDNLKYNYLYLNPLYCDYTNIAIYKEIILNCNSNYYNMIGISYGGYAAIVYASIFPTKSLIIVDPTPLSWVVNIETCIKNINSKNINSKNINTMIYYHRSLHPHDILEFTKIRTELEKSSLFYTIRCSLSEVHSANIPNEEMILQYIQHSELLDKCKILMSDIKMSELNREFLIWT